MRVLSLLVSVIVASTVLSAPIDSWFKAQKLNSLNYLLGNISRYDTPKGFVVASPSKHDPNYYYHWVRDAALVMRALDRTLEDGSKKDQLFFDYIKLVQSHQNTWAITGLGEPKFNADGTSYQEPWGRPQNDGPALRALTLTHYALKLLDQGREDFVREHLYQGVIPAIGIIKRDLEYTSHNWKNSDFDLWEEVMGTHFYTRMAQRSAMFLGAKLAERLEDHGAAKWYYLQYQIINDELNAHYDEDRKYIMTTLNRVGGLDYKYSNIDASAILAVNHSWIPGLSFGPTDYRVIETYNTIVQKFHDVYEINHKGLPAVAVGRYPEDVYFGGNPWFILTNAMAEYLVNVSRLTKDSDPEYSRVALRLSNDYLKRVKIHMGPTGRMDEQFSKYNGYMLGARDLTWSYASFITIK